ncbi:hypothetical protein IPA_03540 [Ignicoccus pacificus DSM 13166]|uniref:Uncharacterized protein n=1 Tax=Ignicoccus pacificus DSM 13166 TaxID=940294 RepID=A0A977KAY4_9CREN|nr:hypothetical protein IPA_03540 [Ignicoccus pacificus DSM 13166]
MSFRIPSEESGAAILLLIKATAEELLKIADEEDKQVIHELLVEVDRRNLKVSDPLLKATIEAVKKDPRAKQKTAELLYPMLKEMIRDLKGFTFETQ